MITFSIGDLRSEKEIREDRERENAERNARKRAKENAKKNGEENRKNEERRTWKVEAIRASNEKEKKLQMSEQIELTA